MALGRPAEEPQIIEPPRYATREILDAIRHVESGGRLHPPDGDGGRSIGPYQIQRSYWLDSRVEGDYQSCREVDYAERVIREYMRRWVPEAWRERDAEVIARVHNGGPRGMRKRATERYWGRVLRRLQFQRKNATGPR